MPSKKMSTKLKEDPVYIWAFKSSKPRAGGQFITYETRLNQDGLTSCNCPGWAFARNGVHSCKHTKKIDDEAKGVYTKWKNGELEEMTYLDQDVVAGLGLAVKKEDNTPKQFMGRVITLD